MSFNQLIDLNSCKFVNKTNSKSYSNFPDDQEVCVGDFVLVDGGPVEVVLDGLNRLPGQHLAEEGALVGQSELAEFVIQSRIFAARFSLVIVFDLN